jgi:hypothetical protein
MHRRPGAVLRVRSTGDRQSASSGAGPTSLHRRANGFGRCRREPGPGHVPPRLVTDVERLYVTRQDELIGLFRQTERGPCETAATPGPRCDRGCRRHSSTSLTCPSSLAAGIWPLTSGPRSRKPLFAQSSRHRIGPSAATDLEAAQARSQPSSRRVARAIAPRSIAKRSLRPNHPSSSTSSPSARSTPPTGRAS